MNANHTQHIRAPKAATGMSRFYSQANLDRYRKLASGAIGEAEQHQLLIDLTEEMNAFRREVRWVAVDQPPPFEGSAGSRVGNQS